MNRVRNAALEDMALASDIMVTSFRTAFAGFVSPETMDACTDPENCRRLLESVYREGKTHFLMGGDQGFLCWQETEDGTEIVAIHSLPASWGTGLGHALLTRALKQIGNRPVYLWAFKENTRARRFYEKHGFHWDGSDRISEFDGAREVRYVKEPVVLLRAQEADTARIRVMQQTAFAELLEKYRDHHMSPATETEEKIRWKITQPGSFYYFIQAGGETVGGIRIVHRNDGSRKRISPLYIMPGYRGRGYAQAAMLEAERIHGTGHWQLDTILQEEGNCRLYEKMGYRQTGHQTVIQENMTIVDYEKD